MRRKRTKPTKSQRKPTKSHRKPTTPTKSRRKRTKPRRKRTKSRAVCGVCLRRPQMQSLAFVRSAGSANAFCGVWGPQIHYVTAKRPPNGCEGREKATKAAKAVKWPRKGRQMAVKDARRPRKGRQMAVKDAKRPRRPRKGHEGREGREKVAKWTRKGREKAAKWP